MAQGYTLQQLQAMGAKPASDTSQSAQKGLTLQQIISMQQSAPKTATPATPTDPNDFLKVKANNTPTSYTDALTTPLKSFINLATSPIRAAKNLLFDIPSAYSGLVSDAGSIPAAGKFADEGLADTAQQIAKPFVFTGNVLAGTFAKLVKSTTGLDISNKDSEDALSTLGQHLINNKLADATDAASTIHKIVTENPEQLVPLLMGANETLSKVAGKPIDAVSDVAKATKIPQVIDIAGDAAKNAALKTKEYFAPTPTINSLVGRVAQGKTGDIPSFGRGIQNMDTSDIKTYSDLNKAASNQIKELATQQDVELSKNPTVHSLSDFQKTIGNGESAVKVNYVEQAIQQLKDYYTKTNDATKLSKINEISSRANESGLSAKDINDLARMHGQDLNGYNANGELASGLSKQAAENTRQGLKDTSRGLMDTPNAKNIDQQMSDLFTVKNLSSKMMEKVNTLSQRLQKPNILQKIGGAVGKFGRSTGVGDLVQKLLGLEKTPGATTLNPVELEAKLSKNLAKINSALSKGDTEFIKDITAML